MNRFRSRLDLPASPDGVLASVAKGALVAALGFVLLGTVSALWANPFFVRMTPAGTWEIAALSLLSLLAGVFVAIRRPSCTVRTAGAGGALGFLGVACPVCNKILLLLFGGELLLAYFEPIRIYVAAAGIVVLFVAVRREWVMRRRSEPGPGGEAPEF